MKSCFNCGNRNRVEWEVVCSPCLKNKRKNWIERINDIMKLKVVLDPGATMPSRAHDTDAGLDLHSRERAVIYAGESQFFDTGVHIEIPAGYVGMVKAKSGLNKNYGVTCTGVVDSGYVGSIGVNLINNGKKHVVIKGNQKIAQLVILPIELPELEQVDSLEDTERGSGGFGSTGEF